ncbi:MAG: GNAT family N-acetyltransferase [Bacteroidia bacterium]|nr:GNAT family N-acetyltransferase [Bacteroidia bacterium]
MNSIAYYIVKPDDIKAIELIADWYLKEWNIPANTTIQRLTALPLESVPFQVMMTLDGLPIATGGLYNHIAQHDHEPYFKISGAWFTLMYTTNENRNRGYGALLCEKIKDLSKGFGLKEIFLFAYTGETLYKRLGWQEIARIRSKDRDIAVMETKLG